MKTCTLEDKIMELCPDSLAWVSAEGVYPYLLADITEVHRVLTELFNQKILDRKLGWFINLKGHKTYQWYYQKHTIQTGLGRGR